MYVLYFSMQYNSIINRYFFFYFRIISQTLSLWLWWFHDPMMSQTQYTIIQQRPPTQVLQQAGGGGINSFTLREPSPITTLTPMSPPTQLYQLQQPQSPSLFDNGNIQFTEIKTEPQPYSPSNVSTTSPLPGVYKFVFKRKQLWHCASRVYFCI